MLNGAENKYLPYTNKQKLWLSQASYFFINKLLNPAFVNCIDGKCLNKKCLDKKCLDKIHLFTPYSKTAISPPWPRPKDCLKKNRDKIVHLHKFCMSQSRIGYKLGEKRLIEINARSLTTCLDLRLYAGSDLVGYNDLENSEETAQNYTGELVNNLKRV